MWFLSFILMMWCNILIGFYVLNHLCIPEIKSHLVMVHTPFYVLLDSVCLCSVQELISTFCGVCLLCFTCGFMDKTIVVCTFGFEESVLTSGACQVPPSPLAPHSLTCRSVVARVVHSPGCWSVYLNHFEGGGNNPAQTLLYPDPLASCWVGQWPKGGSISQQWLVDLGFPIAGEFWPLANLWAYRGR